MVEYDYPGNVRELSNFIERGVALAHEHTLDIEHLPQNLGSLTVRVFKPEMASTPTTLKEQETEHILNALKMADGNRTQAAKILGIDRVSLWRKLKKLGLTLSFEVGYEISPRGKLFLKRRKKPKA